LVSEHLLGGHLTPSAPHLPAEGGFLGGAPPPPPAGRPAGEHNHEVEALEARVAELEAEQRAALLREEIARVMPELLHPPEGRTVPGIARARGKKKKRKGKRR
jgi:uncharacterized small protein (DUF1192 family)